MPVSGIWLMNLIMKEFEIETRIAGRVQDLVTDSLTSPTKFRQIVITTILLSPAKAFQPRIKSMSFL